ncbi:MAG: hypothetical protein KHX55_03905 [Proteobacteria bacterium]|nr:hypothetical protein [Pseudomonadota bacterium]
MSAIETAKQYWGESLPDWIEVLANEADKTSQNKIAYKIGKSSAAISQILKKSYPGTIANLEAAVRANLMNGSHDCPFYGTILIRECLDVQSRPFSNSGNPTKIRLFKACRNCIHHKKQGE